MWYARENLQRVLKFEYDVVRPMLVLGTFFAAARSSSFKLPLSWLSGIATSQSLRARSRQGVMVMWSAVHELGHTSASAAP
jgi:hypothetical protein